MFRTVIPDANNVQNKEINSESNRFVDLMLLDKILKKCELIIKKINNLKSYEESGDFENLYLNSRRVVSDCENLVQMTRRIPINYGDSNGYLNLKEDLKQTGTENSKVKISMPEKDVIHIVLQDLLPRRMQNGKIFENLDYIRCQYVEAFRHYFLHKKIEYNERVVIYFKNFFTSEKAMIDDDNFDSKIITDVIAQYVLIDDNPKRCIKIFDYGISEESRTEILVFPYSKLIHYLDLPFS